MADLPIRANPRNVRTLRDNFRRWLSAKQGEVQQEILTLLKTATKGDHERVVMACKILDKLLPDQREYLPMSSSGANAPGGRPINIVIGQGVDRGPAWARVRAVNPTNDVKPDDEEE
jgi:hypothetical protein